MCSSKQIKELAERNAIYEFEKRAKMYGKEYIRYYYNKLAELNGSINSTCKCQHNSNSRDNEPCCRCDSRASENDDTKNKVTSLEIIVRMIDNKPYYEIKYKKVGEYYYHVGYSSFNIDNVLKWRDECFELVESDREERSGLIDSLIKMLKDSNAGFISTKVGEYTIIVTDDDDRAKVLNEAWDDYVEESEEK